MAITAMAGPGANFIMALAAGLARLLLFLPMVAWTQWTLLFLARVALLSVGLGLFNLIPISPLDGSKILFFPVALTGGIMPFCTMSVTV